MGLICGCGCSRCEPVGEVVWRFGSCDDLTGPDSRESCEVMNRGEALHG